MYVMLVYYIIVYCTAGHWGLDNPNPELNCTPSIYLVSVQLGPKDHLKITLSLFWTAKDYILGFSTPKSFKKPLFCVFLFLSLWHHHPPFEYFARNSSNSQSFLPKTLPSDSVVKDESNAPNFIPNRLVLRSSTASPRSSLAYTHPRIHPHSHSFSLVQNIKNSECSFNF